MSEGVSEGVIGRRVQEKGEWVKKGLEERCRGKEGRQQEGEAKLEGGRREAISFVL